jgi:hypothetical protein
VDGRGRAARSGRRLGEAALGRRLGKEAGGSRGRGPEVRQEERRPGRATVAAWSRRRSGATASARDGGQGRRGAEAGRAFYPQGLYENISLS